MGATTRAASRSLINLYSIKPARLGQARLCMYRLKLLINNQANPSCHVSVRADSIGYQNQQAASSTGRVHIYIVHGWLA